MGNLFGAFVNILASILLWLSNLTGGLGLGIILFTVLVRIAMLPLTIKQLQSSKKMQELQPLIQELRRKYGKDQQTFTQEMTKIYREHKANPAGSCLPLLIQLPIFIGVWQAVQRLATNPAAAGSFLWLDTLSLPDPYYILPILSIVLQMLVSAMAMPKIQDPQQKIMSQTMLLMPILFGYIAFTINAGAVLYWVTNSFLAAIQQFFVTGWGSLTTYLPFLPERQGYLTPIAPMLPIGGGASENENTAKPAAIFWAPLAKLQPGTALPASDPAAEARMVEARQPRRSKKRRS